MQEYPEHLDKTERRIISTILREALHDCDVSVHDGEEWAVRHSTNLAEITREIAATDCTTLRFYRKDAPVGSVLLVHGNGCDVIADYTASEAMETLLAAAIRTAERLADA